jgi:hypothetical protein
LRASADAERLAREIGFAAGRLLVLAAEPPDLYGEMRSRARADLEWASWACLLIAYLSPLQDDDPFAGIRAALAGSTMQALPDSESAARDPSVLPDLSGIALGPRTSHDRARGSGTLIAYLQWVERGGATAAARSELRRPARRSSPSPATRPGAPSVASTASLSGSRSRVSDGWRAMTCC